jgi:hypothetical protein
MSLFWYSKHWGKKETKEFVEWFEKDYGAPNEFPSDDYEQDEYWLRRGFALYGYLHAMETKK